MIEQEKIEKESIGLFCRFCRKMYGTLSFDTKEQRLDVSRMLSDYKTWAICTTCVNLMAKVELQTEESVRAANVRNHE